MIRSVIHSISLLEARVSAHRLGIEGNDQSNRHISPRWASSIAGLASVDPVRSG